MDIGRTVDVLEVRDMFGYDHVSLKIACEASDSGIEGFCTCFKLLLF